MRKLAFILLSLAVLTPACAGTTAPTLAPGSEQEWRFATGRWSMAEGVLEQANTERLSAAILKGPAFANFKLSVELNVRPAGNGVRAAAILFRATGTMSYYWLHLDSKNNQAILVRSTPADTWKEITRKHVELKQDEWHTAQVECAGAKITISVDGNAVLSVEDAAIASGRVGLGTSQGRVAFRNLKIDGEPLERSDPLQEELPPFKIISRGKEAGPYQAFPDACRLKNGDIVAVFYAGYGHVSWPNADWPKGGRICMVRSKDEGRTWSTPRILFDDEDDNRDPHIAQMSDGTVICSFFSLRKVNNANTIVGVQLARSRDGGETWEDKAQTIAPEWAVSAPVRELPDHTYVLGIYWERSGKAWGGVVRSTDRGKTWGEPIPIGKESEIYLDSETDVIRLKDGTLYAALRSSPKDEYCATSTDNGLTWSAVRDLGFKGHCPHLNRLKDDTLLLIQRIPATALFVSRDEAKTWKGPYQVDTVGGAYPATVELKDGTVLAVYYEEGEGSAIRALRFRVKEDGIETLKLE